MSVALATADTHLNSEAAASHLLRVSRRRVDRPERPPSLPSPAAARGGGWSSFGPTGTRGWRRPHFGNHCPRHAIPSGDRIPRQHHDPFFPAGTQRHRSRFKVIGITSALATLFSGFGPSVIVRAITLRSDFSHCISSPLRLETISKD